MQNTTLVNSQRPHITDDATGESSAEERDSVKILLTVHGFMITFIGFLAFCLKLKFPDMSPYELDDYGTVIMDLVIIDTCFYVGSLVVTGILAARNNTEFTDVIIKISFLIGSVPLILELLLLIPLLGGILVCFWIFCLVCFVIKSYQDLKKLFRSTIVLVCDHIMGSNDGSENPNISNGEPGTELLAQNRNINIKQGATEHRSQDGNQIDESPI